MINIITIKGPASYKEKAVLETQHNVNLIYGLNGAGKSTLLNLCAGLDRANAGKILIRERVKIFFLKQFLDAGLLIQKFNNTLFETVTLIKTDITAVFTVRTVINRFQVVGRITVNHKQMLFLLCTSLKR